MNNIEIDLELVTRTFEKGIRDAVKAANSFQKSINSNFSKVDKRLDSLGKESKRAGDAMENSFNRADAAVGSFFGNLAAQTFTGVIQGIADVSSSIAQLGKESLLAVVDAEETESKFNTVFSNLRKSSNDAVQDLIKNYGLASTQTKLLLGDTGDLLTGFGFSQTEALKLSTQVQKLAVDLASFQNVQGGAEEASRRLTKGILGETEGLKSLGIVVNKRTLDAKRTELALQGVTFASEQQEKAAATLAIAIDQSKNSIGDYAKTQDSTANQMRLFENTTTDLKEAIGKGLEPTFRSAILEVNRFLKSLDVKEITAFVTSGVQLGVRALGNLVDGFKSFISIANRVSPLLPILEEGFYATAAAVTAYQAAITLSALKSVGFVGVIAKITAVVGPAVVALKVFIAAINPIALAIAGVAAAATLLIRKFDLFGKKAKQTGSVIDKDFNGVISNTKKELEELNNVNLTIFDEIGKPRNIKIQGSTELTDNTEAANIGAAPVENDAQKKSNKAALEEQKRHENEILKLKNEFNKRRQELTLSSGNIELETGRAKNEQELKDRLDFNLKKIQIEEQSAIQLNEKLKQSSNKREENDLKIRSGAAVKKLEAENAFQQQLFELRVQQEEKAKAAAAKAEEEELKRKTEFNEKTKALDIELAEQRSLFDLERRAAEIENRGARNLEDLNALRQLELQKLQIIKDAEIKRASLIKDNDARILKFKEINLKFQLDKEKAVFKSKQLIEKGKEKASIDGFNSVLNATDEFFNVAQALAGKDAKKKKRLALAQALISGYQAVVNGFATAPFLPAGLAAGAIATAKTVATISKIRSTNVGNFANGGIIGGGSFTGDNLVANVNSGEAILNSQQQKNFMRLANGAESAGTSGFTQAINMLGDRISSMEIVLTANDTEIARSVSRGVQDGIIIGESR